MSIPPNQFRRDHPWTRFVLLDSSAGPVPSQAKVTHSLTLSLKKKSNTCRSTETSTDDVLLCLAGRVDKLVDFGCISIGRSVYTRSPGSHLVNCQRTRLERDGIAKTRR